jgi:hypothetical protein
MSIYIYIYALLAVAARQADEKAMAMTMTRARNIGALPPVPFLTSAMATKRWMYLEEEEALHWILLRHFGLYRNRGAIYKAGTKSIKS